MNLLDLSILWEEYFSTLATWQTIKILLRE